MDTGLYKELTSSGSAGAASYNVPAKFVEESEPDVTLNISPRKVVHPTRSNLLSKLGCIFIATIIFVVIVAVLYLTVLVKDSTDMSLVPDESDLGNDIHILKRDRWGGEEIRDSYQNLTLVHPINLVIISHTATSPCMTFEECSHILRKIQSDHVSQFNYVDIKYNFLIGGDGNIYEALGWDIQNYLRNNSIQISFIGNYIYDQVIDRQRIAVQALLKRGVELRKLDEDYRLIAHNRVVTTKSPGQHLLSEIKLWPHYYNGTLL